MLIAPIECSRTPKRMLRRVKAVERDVAAGLDGGVGRARQVGRALDELRDPCGERVEHLPSRGPRRKRIPRGELRDVSEPVIREPVLHPAGRICGELRVGRGVALEAAPASCCAGRGPVFAGAAPKRRDLVGNQELGVLGPAVGALGRRDFRDAECRAVRLRRIVLVRRAVPDVGGRLDQRRPTVRGLRRTQDLVDFGEVVAVGDPQHAPAGGVEALRDILGERQGGRSVKTDRVVVVDADQLAKAKVPGKATPPRRRCPP